MWEELTIIAVSMLPTAEYHVAIPIALFRYHLDPGITLLLVSIGGLGIFFPLYFGLMFFRQQVERRFPKMLVHIDRFVERARSKMKDDYEKYGAFALFIAQVIPVPLTGVWTLTVAAVVLKIPFRQSFVGIVSGGLVGASVVTITVLWFGRVF